MLGLLTYEIGLALPFFFLFYGVLTRRKLQYAFYYLVPLVMVLAIRYTEWFGFGHVRLSRDITSFDPTLIILHVLLFFGTSVLIFFNQIQFSIMGWMHISPIQIVQILGIDLILMVVILIYLQMNQVSLKSSFKFIILLLTGLVTFAVPYILTTGGSPTRGYIFIDIFVAGLIIYGLLRVGKGNFGRYFIVFFIFIALLICQGLYINWVASGELSDTIAGYFCSHSDEVNEYPYVYFNSTDFVVNAPNGLLSAYHPTREDLFRLKREVLGNLFGDLIRKLGKEDLMNRIDSGYVQYYNAKCLDQWAFSGMLKKCNLSNITLIYGGNWFGYFPTYVGKDEIRYQKYEDSHPAGPEITIPRSQVLEITYSRIFGTSTRQPLTLF